ncbi:MAG: DNA primase [Candidatus Sulfotelmatobacter sp.]
MANPGDFAYTVKQQADIVRIIGDYIKLKKAGAQNYSGLCPFHGEKTPSFSVHATRQFYHCFGCGVSGDVFSFVQKIENITFPESVRMVAQKLGIPLPKASYSTPGEAKEARLRGQLLDVHERAVAFFQECLKRPEGARAREYLTGRGLDQEMIARFRIGYAPDSGFLLRDCLKEEFSEEVLRESGLFSWKQDDRLSASGPRQASDNSGAPSLSARSLDGQGGDFDSTREPEAGTRKPEAAVSAMYSKFRNRVVFPIASEAGKVIAFTGRTLATDEKSGPKYLNSPETPIYSKGRVLFNLDVAKEWIKKFDYAILVEGQMDCISVYAAGFHNVIASSGTAFTELQAKLLGRFSKNAVVNFDPDTAGAKATERTLGLLVEEEFTIKVLTLDQGFDPDLYIRRKGKEAYGAALKHSLKYFDYLIERARTQFPVRSGEGKQKAVNYLLPHIQRVPSRIVRDELAHEISQKLSIDSAVLRQELRHAASTRATSTVKAPVEAQATDAEKVLIRALASARQMSGEEHLSARDGAEEEFDPARQAQFVLQNEALHRGLATESLAECLLNAGRECADVLEVPATEGDRRMLASILLKEDEELTAEVLEAAVRALRRIHLRRRQEDVQQELKKPGLAGDKDRLKELLLDLERISRALRDPSLAEDGLKIPGTRRSA